MTDTLELTGNDVCRAVEKLTGHTEAGDALVHVRSGYRRFLAGVDPRCKPPVMHQWSFLQPVTSITLAATTTGTATGVYDDSSDTTTITATTSIFLPFHAGLTITVAGATGELQISSVTSGTVLVANGGADFAGQTVTIQNAGIYDLPADFDGFVEAPKYEWLATRRWVGEPTETSPEGIRHEWAQSNTPEYPRQYSVVLTGAPAADEAQTWQLYVSPRPKDTVVLWYRYRVQVPDVHDDTDSVFLGGPSHSETIKAFAMAAAEIATGHVEGVWSRLASELMFGSIDHDKQGFDTTAPVRMRRSGGYERY